jgi:hypothetical protein
MKESGGDTMKYLVVGSGGPGFASSDEALHVLESIILPSFDELIALEKENKILGGGLPVGDRSFVFIAEAVSNDELDKMLRNIPMWGSLDWEVTALQTFLGRADQERVYVNALKSSN